MNLQQIFTTRLKDARKRRKLSQEALGIAIGLDESVASTRINRYENGIHQPDWGTLAKIAERYERCHKHCQRQSLRHQSKCKIVKEFSKNADGKSLAHYILNIAPKDIHQEHEKTDAECCQEQQQKAL